MAESHQRPLRIGILGTARIARFFIAGVSPSNSAKVSAVASRSIDKAKRFAKETGIPSAYGSYLELLSDPDIDAIYNALPNSLHAEWTIRALEASKHVLCEKPLATTASEARSMFLTARRYGMTLVEGFPYRAQPQSQKLKSLLDDGAIGQVQTMQAAIGFTLSDASDIRLDPSLGGGALMDAGTYPVSLVRLVAGERPRRVHAFVRWHRSGVDQSLIASLEHAGGLLAQISCSFSTSGHRQALIAGTAGTIQTTFQNSPALERPAVLHLRRGVSPDAAYETVEVPALNGFRAEAESFGSLISRGDSHWTGVTPDESVDIMVTLEAILESARREHAVDIVG